MQVHIAVIQGEETENALLTAKQRLLCYGGGEARIFQCENCMILRVDSTQTVQQRYMENLAGEVRRKSGMPTTYCFEGMWWIPSVQ